MKGSSKPSSKFIVFESSPILGKMDKHPTNKKSYSALNNQTSHGVPSPRLSEVADFSAKLWDSVKRSQKTSLCLGNLRPAEGATGLPFFFEKNRSNSLKITVSTEK